MLTTVNQVASGIDIASTTAAILNKVDNDIGLMAFIKAASAAGQTNLGPGDIGNYFPNSTGNLWIYQSTKTVPPQAPVNFTKTDSFTGTIIFNGLVTSVLTENQFTPYYQVAPPLEDYSIKNSQGYIEYGNNDPTDILLPQIAPVTHLIFPIQPGRSFGQINKTGLSYGQDLDGDGIPETFNYTSVAIYVDFETTSVIAGTFANSVKITVNWSSTVILSKTKTNIVTTGIENIWLAPGIGIVKLEQSTQGQNNGSSVTIDSENDELSGYIVENIGYGLRIQITPTAVTLPINGTQQFTASVFDQYNNAIYGLTFAWNSTPAGVVSIDGNGLATGILPGTATITAEVAGIICNPAVFTVEDFRTVPLGANNIIYDPLRGLIYASVSGKATALGNTITTIDPNTGMITSSVFIGSEPDKLAISDDGQFLYAGLDGSASVGRLNLNTQSPDLYFSLGSNPTSGVNYPGNIQVLPGSPHSIAISVHQYQGDYEELKIYDDGVQRTNSIPYGGEVFVVSNEASTIYSFVNFSPNQFNRIQVSASGLSLIDSTSGIIGTSVSNISLDSGLLYTSAGDIINPSSSVPTEIGNFGQSALEWVIPDSQNGRTYFLDLWGQLNVFNDVTLKLIGIYIPPVSSRYAPPGFIRWGSNGYAYVMPSNITEIALVRTSLIP